MMNSVIKHLPYFATGVVVKGFGRGSKQLGVPTANYSQEVVDHLPSDVACGVYYGWANVNDGPVYKMVMSIGWNPFYKNEKKSMEIYIINQFDQDFYGAVMKIAILGYLRKEKNFDSIGKLIEAIHEDIKQANSLLDRSENYVYRTHSHFQPQDGGTPSL